MKVSENMCISSRFLLIRFGVKHRWLQPNGGERSCNRKDIRECTAPLPLSHSNALGSCTLTDV